jgi:hypothetical protein
MNPQPNNPLVEQYEWDSFLHQEKVEYQGRRQTRYRLYHFPFFEFVAAKQEVADERVDLDAMRR